MLERIEYLATISIARACGFAALGIVTFFIGMADNPVIAFKSAGYLAFLTCAVLLLKAALTAKQNYRSTELWMMLKPTERPDPIVAQHVISTVLREVYLRFAGQAAFLAMLFLVCGIAWEMLRH